MVSLLCFLMLLGWLAHPTSSYIIFEPYAARSLFAKNLVWRKLRVMAILNSDQKAYSVVAIACFSAAKAPPCTFTSRWLSQSLPEILLDLADKMSPYSGPLPDLTYIAAPMINQSDLPFRLLVRSHGATLAYTQMLIPERILNDPEYLEFHQRELGIQAERPVVVQLCGNEVQSVVEAARKMVGFCDGVGEFLLVNHCSALFL
jgi:hypothetical protein